MEERGEDDEGHVDRRQVAGQPLRQVDPGNRASPGTKALGE
ncbi:MAG: hypothetical protein ACLPKE_06635 [Streptosporangiaceae bacterium]